MKKNNSAAYLIFSLSQLPIVLSFVQTKSPQHRVSLLVERTNNGKDYTFDSNEKISKNRRIVGTALNVATFDTSVEAEKTVKTEDKEVTSLLDDSITGTTLIVEKPNAKSFRDDGFVFGLEGSGLVRPKGKVANVVVENDSLETKPYQVALVSATLMCHCLLSSSSISEVFASSPGMEAFSAMKIIATIFFSFLLADFGSGVLHWSVDNYGNGKTPVMGNIIAAFQGHHSAPWTITERGFCNNVHKLCFPFGIPTIALIAAVSGPLLTLFFSVFCTMEIMSQEFHKWSHMSKKDVPSIVNRLMKIGLIIGRVPHAQHHIAPFEGRYCIVSGICNSFLDDIGFFRMLEHIIYKVNGVEPNSWKLDLDLRAKTLRGVYKLDTKMRRQK